MFQIMVVTAHVFSITSLCIGIDSHMDSNDELRHRIVS